MAILKVARMGNPVLSRRAEPVDPAALPTADLQRLVDDMIETMRDERGVGLAGPQVHRSLRLFVMELPEDVEGPQGPIVVVNPVLTFPGPETMRLWEGCLSMPGIRGLTRRWRAVQVSGLDRRGRRLELELAGFPAAVAQHENDHLDGILFLQRMPDLSRIAFEDELERHRDADASPDGEASAGPDGESGEDGEDGEDDAAPGSPGSTGEGAPDAPDVERTPEA
jgi:peptide deformylase